MAENSKIEWCHHTFNAWIGCTRVSPGCANCYAESMSKRRGWAKWGPGEQRVRTSAQYWKQPHKWNREAAAEGVRRTVFCASLADVFEPGAELERHRADLFKLIADTPALIWLLLTKRPEHALEIVRPNNGWDPHNLPQLPDVATPPKFMIGVTVENQAMLDKRAGHIAALAHHAPVFLSCEPLLSEIVFPSGEWLADNVAWLIAGGESGHAARPMNGEWARSLRDQCKGVGVPFFFKQWGEYQQTRTLGPGKTLKRIGKHAAGRVLDGRTHDATPAWFTAATKPDRDLVQIGGNDAAGN
jgi:protein gp37